MNRVKVIISVDTEHSIGGAFKNPELKPVGNEKRIFGQVGDEHFGIPLIMDIADRYGLKVVFFVEVLNKYFFGEEETRIVCEYIQERGHEVQLHLHPNYLNFKHKIHNNLAYKDNLFTYDFDQQFELLNLGRQLLEKYGVKNVTAFRAGNYGINRIALEALKRAGFKFDSSYNLTFLKRIHGFKDLVINDATRIDGIWELPITNFIQTFPARQFKPLDLNGINSDEMIRTLKWAGDSGKKKFVTIILHSFSFLEPLDVQYSKVKVRHYVINRFKALCRFLGENKERFSVTGFNDINLENSCQSRGGDHFLTMPKMISIKRLAEQAVHRFI